MSEASYGRPPAGAGGGNPLLTRAARAFERFVQTYVSSSRLLLLATALALVWANSPWTAAYTDLWQTHLAISLGPWSLDYSLQHWVNDGLMALFFLVVGLEIKREILIGELRSPRRAALPIFGAIGGMVVPALIYMMFNAGHPGAHGWGIPMATDIAFALAVLTALGDKVPFPLKVFLTALAIVDDLGAVLVIALFYTAETSVQALVVSLALVGVLAIFNWLGVRRIAPYAVVGVLVWLAMLQSGVHATVAGVLVAMTIPARNRIDVDAFVARTRARADELEAGERDGVLDGETDAGQQAAIADLEIASEEAETPLQQVEHRLNGVVAFAIVPLFALANAGVSFGGDAAPSLDRVAFGVLFGLLIGKQIGITLAAWLAVRAGIATLPTGTGMAQLYGVAVLGGIGFTMSLFVAELAFDSPALLASAKLGIFGGSLLSLALGVLLLNLIGKRVGPAGVAADGRPDPA